MLATSKIQKGRRFENYICEQIETEGLGKSTREIGSGSGKRKGDIFTSIDFCIEVKNHKHLNWWGAIKQAQEQARKGYANPDKWALIARNPKTPETAPEVIAVIDFWVWLKMIKRSSNPISKEPDRNLKYKLEHLKNSINQVLRELQ